VHERELELAARDERDRSKSLLGPSS
jgi:hypothetical protein